MKRPELFRDQEYAPGSVGDIFRLIRSGAVTSRSALARKIGMAPSTVSLRVDALVRLGLVAEGDGELSRGGRRARSLEVPGSAGFVGAMDVGAHHVQLAIADLTGVLLVVEDVPVSIEDGPSSAVERLWCALTDLVVANGLEPELLRGVAIGLPAPIEFPSGRVVLPSFMPSWHNADLPALFSAHTAVPVLVENDANLIALAEQSNVHPETDELLAIKLGTRIGCGIISSGRLHRGVGGAAGEISHTSVEGTSTISCVCGAPHCLESVASGGAIVARLAAEGYDVRTASDVVELGRGGDAHVVDVLRTAGTSIGGVLSSIVNFFNPRDVVLGGAMSASAPLVAAIRAELFQKCLPLVTNDLEVRAASSPGDAGVRGATHLILEEVLAPARIERLVRELDGAAAS
ncbi:ROK family transcriptional regulator [Subtercola sp. RTI3]|uniref:ROK family transcriptional regulator n=1 Tax=Subtercola sp. RTI3 TaxID=3048639 RepID=UPI002B239F88|nr:ROK family transcriptional regulator [Subtercola sp. RTI3]MEA9983967.1 ROK family transcriptional regulator [Subtercola sp. RTI3]